MERPAATFFFSLIFLVSQICCKTECRLGAIDLVFVMDESKSVGASNFKVGLQAAVTLTQSLDIGTTIDKSRVGFVVFAEEARTVFNLSKYTDNIAVLNAIQAIQFQEGFTDIAQGMHQAIYNVFLHAQRPSVPSVMIIITDGQDDSNVHKEHLLATELSIITYALGVSKDAALNELYNATGDFSHVYMVDDYAGLSGAMQNICISIAPSATPPPTSPPPSGRKSKTCGCSVDELITDNYWLDIIFVVDSSSGVSSEDFQAMKEFLTLMKYVNIDPTPGNPQYTRIAIVNTAASATRVANLTTIKSSADLDNIVTNNLPQSGGIEFNAQAGLRAASDMIEEEEAAHRRDNVRKVVVMFSTASIDCYGKQAKAASSNETDILCQLVSVMQDDGVVLITVGLQLAGETEFPYIDIADKCNQLDNNEGMTEKLLVALCRANCYCLEPYTQFTVGQDGCDKYAECVYVHGLAISSTGARETCQKEDSIVTPVFSKSKNDFIIELHVASGFFPFWIGVNCTANQCTYSDGTELQPSDYKKWCNVKSQPDFSRGSCVYEKQCDRFDLAWYSEKCGNLLPSHYFSCQKESCSVNNYCEYLKTSKISTRKVLKRTRSSSL